MNKTFNLVTIGITIGSTIFFLILSIFNLAGGTSFIFEIFSSLTIALGILSLCVTIFMLVWKLLGKSDQKFIYIPNFICAMAAGIIGTVLSVLCIINGTGPQAEYVNLALGLINLLLGLTSLTLNFIMFNQWVKN